MSSPARADPSRPPQVTIAGFLTLFGSVFALVGVFQGMSQLYSAGMSAFLRDVIGRDVLARYDLTLDLARQTVKYMLMVTSVFASASLVLGWFVLHRNTSSRLVLSVMGILTVLVTLVAGPQLWVVAVYVASAVLLLWSKPAREWFTLAGDAGGAGTGGDAGSGGDAGDAGYAGGPGVPPAATGPRPPPPPPPRPR